MRKIGLLLVLVTLCCCLKAQQDSINALTEQLNKASHDSTKSLLLADLSKKYLYPNTDSALKLAQRGLLLAKSINFKRGEGANLVRLAQGYATFGNFARAMDNFLVALKIAENEQDNKLLVQCYGGLAIVYAATGELHNALEYDLRSLKLERNEEQKVNANLNIGDDYEKLNQLDSAKYYTNIAYDLAAKRKDIDAIGVTLNNLGNVYLKMGQPEVAMANYRLSLATFTQSFNYGVLCETTLGMAKIFLQNGRDDSALVYAKKSFDVAYRNNFGPEILKAGNFLADYYRKHNVVDSAYAYISYVIASKDSMYSQEKTNQLKNLAFDEAMRQQEIEVNRSIEKQTRDMNIQFAIIAVSVVTFVIVFFLISQSVIVNEKWVHFLGVLALLLVFEFINLLIHPWLERITHHSPSLMLLILVGIASILIPLHHRIEKWIDHRMVTKNKRLRLSAARRTVARLEKDRDVQ